MKFLPLTASMLALALFAAPAFAQEEVPAQEQPAAEQPAAPAVEEAAPQIPEEVLALLNDSRPLSEMSVDELGGRAKQARGFAKMKDLPPDVREQLQSIAQAARGEIAAREEQAAQPAAPVAEQPVEAPVEKKVEAPVEAAAPEPAEQPAEDAAPAAVEIPQEVTDLLNDQRPLGELNDTELSTRFKTAREFSKAKKLPGETRGQLAEIAKAARGEMLAREQSAQKVPDPVVQPEATEQPPVVEQPVLAEPPPVVEQPAVVETQAPAAAPADAKQSQQLDGNAAVPEAEAKAKAFLDDPTPADTLSDEALRTRLDGIRDLMAGNELSRKTEQALRKKLRVEREILRNRVALAEPEKKPKPDAGTQPVPGAEPVKPSKFKKKDYTFNLEIVLNDRRPSEELQDYELSRRLEVYRQYDQDERYDEDQRAYWRQVRLRDEALLQQRLLRERRQRQAELAAQYDDQEYDIELGDEYDPNQQQDDVYAAEVDDQELEDVLAAPPRRKIERRYTVEEVEASSDLREALPRVEIDTVHFGFNEAFVRAEEVGNLDRLGEILERILSKHPREIFLIEGHTDAVGSDAANLALSRLRSAAIKKALTTYYVIPPQNLKTVGYGERYLKIPTAEAEQENRRVSVSRGTAVFGELDQ